MNVNFEEVIINAIKNKFTRRIIFLITETKEFEISWKALKYNLILKLIKCS